MAHHHLVVTDLLDEAALEESSVVANASMNRERRCEGDNSYAKDLGFSPLAYLRTRLQTSDNVAWLDLCCGRGRALIEAAGVLASEGLGDRVRLLGVDLMPMFDDYSSALDLLQLQAASLSRWEPVRAFDLITCVHGLHYLGDKVSLIERACRWLAVDGTFVAHLDANNLMVVGDSNGGHRIVRDLRRVGLEYHSRRHLLRCDGRRLFSLDYNYLGADDNAGPNYTKQPVVNSYYRSTDKR